MHSPTSSSTLSVFIGERERANLVVRTARIRPYVVQLRMLQHYALLFIRKGFKHFHMLSVSSGIRGNATRQARTPPKLSRIAVQRRERLAICCALRYLTEAVYVVEITKVRVVNRLGWLMHIQSIRPRSRSPKMPPFDGMRCNLP